MKKAADAESAQKALDNIVIEINRIVSEVRRLRERMDNNDGLTQRTICRIDQLDNDQIDTESNIDKLTTRIREAEIAHNRLTATVAKLENDSLTIGEAMNRLNAANREFLEEIDTGIGDNEQRIVHLENRMNVVEQRQNLTPAIKSVIVPEIEEVNLPACYCNKCHAEYQMVYFNYGSLYVDKSTGCHFFFEQKDRWHQIRTGNTLSWHEMQEHANIRELARVIR